jgi:hypothetical protein
MMVRLLGVAAVAVLTLAGCGNPASDATASPASPSTRVAMEGPPPPNSTYANAAALRDAAVAAGYSCDNWKAHENTMAASAGRCSPVDSFATYKSQADANTALHLVLTADHGLGHGVITQTYLVGPNWIIAGLDRGQLKRLSRDLGGQLHHA